jgi:hypothetical protein
VAIGSLGVVFSGGTGRGGWVYDGCFDTNASSSTYNITVGVSNFVVTNFEFTSAAGGNGCMTFWPNTSSTSIHNVGAVGNIVNICQGDGISAVPYLGATGPAGVDYSAFWYNVVYRAGQIFNCGAALNIYEPVATDNLDGAHIFVAYNVAWSTGLPTPPCHTDNGGLKFDTFDGSQTPLANPYHGLGAAVGNVLFNNAGYCVNGANNYTNGGQNGGARLVYAHNTCYGNLQDASGGSPGFDGEIDFVSVLFSEARGNLIQATVGTQTGAPAYGLESYHADTSVTADYNFILGVGGNHASANTPLLGFANGNSNILGQSPSFAGTPASTAPSCGSAATMFACTQVAAILAALLPTNSAAYAMGALPWSQVSSTAIARDSGLTPKWICTLNGQLPAWTLQGLCQ